jgi:MSHA biogenesis protein MshL
VFTAFGVPNPAPFTTIFGTSDQNNIALHIHPAITNVTTLDKTFTTPDGNYTLSTPLNEVRESDNIVTAQSGQLVV